MKSFLGNFYRHLAIFSGHTARESSLHNDIAERMMKVNPNVLEAVEQSCTCRSYLPNHLVCCRRRKVFCADEALVMATSVKIFPRKIENNII